MNKKTFIALLLSSVCFSCSTYKYQISTIESSDVMEDFTFENEDLKLSYNFWEYRGQLSFTITNKTNEAIFIDWKHSNFIFNGYSYDYFNNETYISGSNVYLNGSVYGYDYNGNSKSLTSGIEWAQGIERSEKPSIQIPPNAHVNSEPIALGYPWISINSGSDTIYYSKNETPLNIRAYIGYSKSKELTNLSYIDNTFWVNSTIEKKPKEAKGLISKDSFFHYGKEPNPLKTGILAAVLATMLIVIITTSN